MPSQIPPRFLLPVIVSCSQLLLKSISKLFENVEWSISLLRHFKIQTLLKINCCMAAISSFRVTQHSQIFSLFFRNRIQCIALYQLYNSQALLNLRRGYYNNKYKCARQKTKRAHSSTILTRYVANAPCFDVIALACRSSRWDHKCWASPIPHLRSG